jgi:hypothetical protein
MKHMLTCIRNPNSIHMKTSRNKKPKNLNQNPNPMNDKKFTIKQKRESRITVWAKKGSMKNLKIRAKDHLFLRERERERERERAKMKTERK